MAMPAKRTQREKKQRHLPNWEKYWRNFTDLELLREKSINLDDTLEYLEKEFGTKLMSGDHMQLVTALEDRIQELERIEKEESKSVQANLFDS